MTQPYDDFNSIPALKDLTPWDSIRLSKTHFIPFLKQFVPDKVRIIPHLDKHAIWFGDEFAFLVKVHDAKRIRKNYETGELEHLNYLMIEGALLCNGIETKEVMNANLKWKGARRAAFLKGVLHEILREMNITHIGKSSITTLIFGTYGSDGENLDDIELKEIQEREKNNKDVPIPLFKITERSLPSHKRCVASGR